MSQHPAEKQVSTDLRLWSTAMFLMETSFLLSSWYLLSLLHAFYVKLVQDEKFNMRTKEVLTGSA